MPESSHAPSLSFAVLLPTTGLLLVVLLFVLARTEGRAARFVIAALWLRYVMGVFHEITFQPMVAGLSPNAMASFGIFALGIFIVAPRRWFLKRMAPVYVLVGVVTLSGVINGVDIGLVNTVVKWGCFAVILLAAYDAALRLGEARSAAKFLWAFAPPLAFQLLSMATGVTKVIDQEGGQGFIGGYNHESHFSIVMLTGLCVAAFATEIKPWIRNTLMVAFLAGIYLAAYRTTLIAAAPIAMAYFAVEIAGWFRARERLAVTALAAVLVLALAGGVAYVMRDKFADFAAIGGEFKAPTEFTRADRQVFSGRTYLWSGYLDAYAHGNLKEQVFGFGPESWKGRFPTYAHNTFVSTLYELGVIGAAALLYLWGAFLFLCARIQNGATRAKAFAAHVSVILLNMATMGQWVVEGLYLYAVVCAITMLAARAPEVEYAPEVVAPRRMPYGRSRAAATRAALRLRARGG